MRKCPTDEEFIYVLYVDDNLDLLVIGKTFMEADSRLDVDTCSNAEEALCKISLGGYDVIVSDYQMPGMDGIEFLKELRHRGDDVPFILFTGKGREEVVMEAYENGAHYYTQKGTDFAPQFADLRNKIVRSYESVRDKRDLEKLRAAVQCSVDGIALFDGKGQHLFTNKAYLRMFGYENEDEVCGKPWSMLYGDDDPDEFFQTLDEKLTEEGYFYRRAKGLRKDGTLFVAETSFTLLDEDNCIMIARDITEQIDKEGELERLNARNSALLNAVPDMMFLLDGEGRFVDAHASDQYSFLFPPEEFIGAKVSDLFDEELVAKTMDAMDASLHTGEVVNYHYTAPKNGGIGLFESRMIPCDDGLFLSLVRDVTELKEAREESQRYASALEENQKLLESILQTQKEMVCRFLPDTTLTFVNDAYCRLFGKSRDELLGMRFIELVPEGDRDGIHSKLEGLGPTQPSVTHVHEVNYPDGTVGWQEWTDVAIFDDDGTKHSFQATGRDITDLVLAKRESEALAGLQRMLMTVTSRFVGVSREEADAAIDLSLAEVGAFTGADRVYIFDYDFDNGSCDNTYEWCAEGIPPEKDNLQNVPISGITEWVGAHSRGEHILIPDVASHHEESMKEILMPQGILSLLTIPMMCGDSCKGFIGFDSVRSHRDFNDAEISLLRLFSDAILSLRLRLGGY